MNGRLLRKRDLVDEVGVAKSTVTDWISEFGIYIATQKHGNVQYYRPEAIDVLLAIKELWAQDYAKPEIMRLLAERGFPITTEEAVQEIQDVISQPQG